jgi:hypothetical protein
MLASLIVVYIQFVIMLTELKKVLSQELKCLFVKQDYHSLIRMNHNKKLWMRVSYNFTALEINKLYRNVYIYIVHTVHICSTGPYVH